MMLKVALSCGDADHVAGMPTVFASRHGDATGTIELLEGLARGEPITANRFSHSVHNTQAGLFSIAVGSRQPASAIAAGRDTFASGFLEALGALERVDAARALLVAGDEPLPPVLARFADEPEAACAIALVLERHTGPGAIALAAGDGGNAGRAPGAPRWPAAAEFLRWTLSGETELVLGTRERSWVWRRDGAGGAG
jgi:hypothetical protein